MKTRKVLWAASAFSVVLVIKQFAWSIAVYSSLVEESPFLDIESVFGECDHYLAVPRPSRFVCGSVCHFLVLQCRRKVFAFEIS